MTFIKTIGDDEAEGKVKRAYEQSRTAGGHVYETTRLLSLWPEALEMEQRRYHTVMLADTVLSRAEKEMIATAVSARNRCAYCVAHHKAMMLEAGVDAELADAVAKGIVGTALDARTQAMLDLATTKRPDLTAEADIARLRDKGLSDREMLEVVVVAGFFYDYNLRVSLFGLELEDWFETG